MRGAKEGSTAHKAHIAGSWNALHVRARAAKIESFEYRQTFLKISETFKHRYVAVPTVMLKVAGFRGCLFLSQRKRRLRMKHGRRDTTAITLTCNIGNFGMV